MPYFAPTIDTTDVSTFALAANTLGVSGAYTVATLPDAGQNARKMAWVTDLGGGAGYVVSDGTWWKHTSLGSPTPNSTTTNQTITALTTAPVVIMTGSILSSVVLTLAPVRLYAGYELYIRKSGLFGGLGSLGLTLQGSGVTLPILANQTSHFIYDGSSLQQL